MALEIQGYRVFLNPAEVAVPGYVAGPGMVMLPLNLDGSMEPIFLGAGVTTPTALAKKLQEMARSSIHPSFVNRNIRFNIHKDEKSFETQYRPKWIEDTAKSITDIVETYAQGEGAAVSGLAPYDLIGVFRANWQRLSSYISSLLYMGIKGDVEGISVVSHLLFGPPLEEGIQGQINFIDDLYQLDHAIYRRLKPRYAVRDPDGTVHQLYEPPIFDSVRATIMTDDESRRDEMIANDERAWKIYDKGENGNVTPRNEIITNSKFESARKYAAMEAARTIGTFIFARVNMRAEDIYSLLGSDSTDCRVCSTAHFLIAAKGISPEVAQKISPRIVMLLDQFMESPYLQSLMGNYFRLGLKTRD